MQMDFVRLWHPSPVALCARHWYHRFPQHPVTNEIKMSYRTLAKADNQYLEVCETCEDISTFIQIVLRDMEADRD